MKIFLICVLIAGFGMYKFHEWFGSQSYINFILKYKEKPWSSRAMYKTAQYYIFIDDWRQAGVFIEECLKEHFEKRPEKPDCLYLSARHLDLRRKRWPAINAYNSFVEVYPNHPKAEISRKRAQILVHAP